MNARQHLRVVPHSEIQTREEYIQEERLQRIREAALLFVSRIIVEAKQQADPMLKGMMHSLEPIIKLQINKLSPEDVQKLYDGAKQFIALVDGTNEK